MAVHNAATLAYADVMTALGLCGAGDTLGLPAGSATWASRFPTVTSALSVIGAGVGSTVITSGYNAPDKGGNIYAVNNLFSFDPSTPADNPVFRLSGMTINCASKCCGILLKNYSLNICNKIRLDHLNLYGCDGWSITRYGQVYGVCDNSTLYGHQENYGTPDVWTSLAYNYGTVDNFYYEDCEIYADSGFIMPGNESPRYAVRHNRIYVTYPGNIVPMFDAHGNQAAGQHSTQGGEIYENIVDCGGYFVWFLDQRGGKFLVYNNQLNNADSYTRTGVREEFLDSTCPPANNVISGQPQHVSDSYYWGNRFNTTNVLPVIVESTLDYGSPKGIVPSANHEFWVEAASFDGSEGVGFGLLSARPSSGLVVGVGYWATDTKTLYRATSATTWAAYYTPYPYPHPLRGEAYDPNPDLTVSSADFAVVASPLTLYAPADYNLVVSSADFVLRADHVTVTPIEATPWDIRLGPLGAEIVLPLLNWPAGSSPEMPEGTTAYVDSVALADGSVQHNFRTYSPRKWTFEWARLTEAEVAVFNELAAYDEPLHFQNKWVSADWHWVIVTACDPVPLTTAFTTGTPFWKLTLSLEEIL